MLSKGTYRGELYDIGYEYPETHCIEKNGVMYYALYNPHFSGTVVLRGLNASKDYSVFDYFNNKNLGEIKGSNPRLKTEFENFLLIEVREK